MTKRRETSRLQCKTRVRSGYEIIKKGSIQPAPHDCAKLETRRSSLTLPLLGYSVAMVAK